MRSWIEAHEVLAVAIAIGVLLVLWYLRAVWAVALIGFILAAALVPLIDWLEARRIPRALAIALTYLALIGILIGIFMPAILSLAAQSAGLADDLTVTLQKILAPGSFLALSGLTPASIVDGVKGAIIPLTSSTVAAAAGLLSTVVISIYLLYDWHDQDGSRSGAVVRFVADAQRELGAWARGQIVLCASIGILSFVALLILGIPYAGPLAALAAVLELIPYAGPIASAIPAIMLGLDASLTEGIAVLIAYVVIQQLESHVLVPLIMKNALRVHPVVVILALLVGFEVMGILGAFIAVPLVSIGRLGLARAGFIHG